MDWRVMTGNTVTHRSYNRLTGSSDTPGTWAHMLRSLHGSGWDIVTIHSTRNNETMRYIAFAEEE